MKIVTSSSELAAALDSGGIVELAAGDYEINRAGYTSIHLIAANPLATRVFLAQPLCLGYFSVLSDITLTPVGDFAALRLDQSSYTHLERVIFNSRKNVNRRLGEKWQDLDREGVGIETTGENDGDNSYGVTLRGCLFQALCAGIRAGVPRIKGTVAWNLDYAVFDGCEIGLDLVRAGEWRVRGGIFQLARVAVNLDGHSNWFDSVHFERNALDIAVSTNSQYNQFRACDARKDKILNEGVDSQFNEPMLHRNISRRAARTDAA